MTCRFRSRTVAIGMKWRIELDEPMQRSQLFSIADLSYWQLEYYSDSVQWNSCEDEIPLSVTFVAKPGKPLEIFAIDVRVSHQVHDRVYRLVCDAAVVDADCNLSIGRFWNPQQIEIEMEGVGSIPSRYLDIERSSETFSQRINLKEGKTDLDGMTLYLVDLNHRWTEEFDLYGMEKISTLLVQALEPEDTEIELDDCTGFEPGQKVFLESECVVLGERTGNVFSSCTRGACFTKANVHTESSKVFSGNPFLAGRVIQIREGGNIVWSGILVRVEPESATSVALEAQSLLAMLDTPVNRNRGTAQLADAVWIDNRFVNGEWQANDRVYANLSMATSEGESYDFDFIPIVIPSGFYDIHESSLGTDRNIVTSLARMLDENLVGCSVSGGIRNGSVWLSFQADRPVFQNIHIGLKSTNRADPYLENRDDSQIYESSLLERLGFDKTIEFDIETRTMLEASDALVDCCGFGKTDYIALLAPFGEDPHSGAASFLQGPGYALIGDELIRYRRRGSQQDVFASTTLARALSDAEVSTVILENGASFHSGNLVRVENEYIILSDSRLEMGDIAIFQHCTRAAMGSEATAHALGTDVDKIQLDALYGLERGLGGKTFFHGIGTQVSETWRGGMNPLDDLQELLDDFELPESVAELSCQAEAGRLLSPMTAYDRWAISDESYFELACDICRSFFVWLATDTQGKLCLRTIRPLLGHETPEYSFNAGSVMSPPVVSYVEGDTLGSVSMQWGKKGGDKSRLLLRDDSCRNYRLTRAVKESLEYSLDCLSASEALMHVYRLARKILFAFSRPRTEIELETTWSVASRLALFDRVTLDFPQLPVGRGKMGIDASTTHWIVSEIEKNLSSRTARIRLLEGITGAGWNFSCVINAYDPTLRQIEIVSTKHLENLEQIESLIRAGACLYLVKNSQLETGTFLRTRKLTVYSVDTSDSFVSLRFEGENFIETTPGNWSMQDESGNPVVPEFGDILVPSFYDDHASDATLKQLVFNADEYAKLGSEDDPAFLYTI